jgi:serine/threonine-protein kinase
LNDKPTKKEAMAPAMAPAFSTLPSATPGVPVEGTMLADKYRVERVLGRGGMGVVVAATHVELDQRVALKFLLPEAMETAEVVERFAREARAAVKIESEHVARVIDVGKLENGLPYMVMEYLNGRDLAALLDEQIKLPIDDALEYVLQACEAIAQAHALGIIHRDLKPANLFVTNRADGTTSIKVLDFGISKVTLTGGPAEMNLTQTAAIMGSPTYMSPEQMRASRDVDPRADIWALGVILYELLSGQPPFVGATMPELCANILTAAPQPLRAMRPDVPEALEAAIMRCLDKNPAGRFANVAELTNAIVDFAPKRARISAERSTRVLRGAGVKTASLPPLASIAPDAKGAPVTVVATATAGAWSQASDAKPAPSKPKPSANNAKFAIAGGIALAGIGGFVALQMRTEPPVVAATVLTNPSAAASPLSAAPEVLAKAEPSLKAEPAPPASAARPTASAAIETREPAAPTAEAAGTGTGANKAAPEAAAKPRAKPTPPAAPPKAPVEPPAAPPAPTRKNPLSIDIK